MQGTETGGALHATYSISIHITTRLISDIMQSIENVKVVTNRGENTNSGLV